MFARSAACLWAVMLAASLTVGCGDSAIDTKNATDPPNYLSVAPGEEVVGPSIQENICFLSKVVGGFNAEGSSVRVFRDKERGKWVLRSSGQGTQSSLSERAGMYCVNRADVASQGSIGGEAELSSAQLEVDGGETDSVAVGPLSMYARTISGMKGEMRGEKDRVWMEPGKDEQSRLRVSSSGTPRTGYGLFVEVSAGERGPVSGARIENAVGSIHETLGVYGADGNDALCFFNEIGGKFDAPQDAIWLDFEGAQWRLNMTTKCTRRGGIAGLGSECVEGHRKRVEVRCRSYRGQRL